MKQSNTYQAEIYEQFQEIDETAFRDIVQFYEHNESTINNLELITYFEIRSAYSMALFEIGRYRDFILLSQDLLEGIIFHNIYILNGDDIYAKVLFKKAAAHYQLLEYDESEKILWDLVRINPNNTVATFLLKRTKIRNQPRYISKLKGVSILLFLLAAVLIAAELLIVRPFFENFAENFEWSRTLIFCSGFLLLVLSDCFHRVQTFHIVNSELDRIRKEQE